MIEGEAVVFTVKVTGVPTPSLTWYQDGRELVMDYSVEMTDDDCLTLPSAELKHSGVYQLVAVNKAGRVERQVSLSVRQEGQSLGHKPEIQTCFSPIPIEEFGDYVVKGHFNDNQGFVDRFAVSLQA